MIDYQLSFLIAVSAFCYACLLTDPGMILNGLFKWLDFNMHYKKANKTCSASCSSCAERGWIAKAAFKIIIGCEKCIAGQVALWMYFFVCTKYQPLQHLFFVMFTIFITAVIREIYYKYIKE